MLRHLKGSSMWIQRLVLFVMLQPAHLLTTHHCMVRKMLAPRYMQSQPLWHRRHPAPVLSERMRLFSILDDFLGGEDLDRLLEEQIQKQKVQEKNTFHTNSVFSPSSGGWKNILMSCNFKDVQEQSQSLLSSDPSKSGEVSPVEHRVICSRTIWIKRDDLLKLENSGISGNKARKMWSLNQIPAEEFPSCVVSYGGPQSNSMLALAAIVNSKNRMKFQDDVLLPEDAVTDESLLENSRTKLRFIYFTKTLPRFLRNQPSGNLFRALSLGMELKELTHREYNQLFEGHYQDEGKPPTGLEPPIPGDSLWVPQGGAFACAQGGTRKLAQEIFSFWLEHGERRPLTVCVPAGTGTTALLLHHCLKELRIAHEDMEPVDVQIVAIPCVGDDSYTRRQMMSLCVQIGADVRDIPAILPPDAEQSTKLFHRPKKHFVFGQPTNEILNTFQTLQDKHELVVDLLYGAPSFAIILRHLKVEEGSKESWMSPDVAFNPNKPLSGREIMYVHSGGLEGINTQLLRYRYLGLVEIEDVQLPGKSTKI
jgi:1-aminocyclopropane-1-carboxylate deaminase